MFTKSILQSLPEPYDMFVVCAGILVLVYLYFKAHRPKKDGKVVKKKISDARYFQISFTLIAGSLLLASVITFGEAVIIAMLGWMISLRFEEGE